MSDEGVPAEVPERKSQADKLRRIIDDWVERDLTADARAESNVIVHGLDLHVQRMVELIRLGRHPIVIGEPGVGKTTLIAEFARRLALGEILPEWQEYRVVQLSIRHRLASLKDYRRLGRATGKLVDALVRSEERIIPFIRDFDLVYHFDLESHVESLAYRLGAPLLGEGDQGTVRALFEYEPSLEQTFHLVEVPEPDLDQVRGLARRWCEARKIEFEPDAIEEAVCLAHRFLARTRQPRKTIEQLERLQLRLGPDASIDVPSVIEHFCLAHHVPRMLIDPAVTMDLDEVRRELSDRVRGQDEAVDAVVRTIGLVKAGLADMRRAFGAFLFVGPTGVGKTHLAQCLAEFLFADREHLIRFNLADYHDESSAELLFGDPKASGLPHMRGQLTQRILGRPFGVLLLDEFEKAHARIHDRFMQLFDEGQFVNAAGETMSCRSLIIIATSNVGSEVFRDRPFGFGESSDRASRNVAVEHSLEKQFRRELLNRFDRVVRFDPLSREDIRWIAREELERLQDRVGVRQRRVTIEAGEDVVDWLMEHGFDTRCGARHLRRTIERDVASAVAATLVGGLLAPGAVVRLAVADGYPVATLELSDRAPTDSTPASTPIRSVEDRSAPAEGVA